jgi:hypothetical protein
VKTARLPRNAISLVLLGLAGLTFFIATDPVWGVAFLRVRGTNLLDTLHETRPGTYVGLIGSTAVLTLGIYLVARRR